MSLRNAAPRLLRTQRIVSAACQPHTIVLGCPQLVDSLLARLATDTGGSQPAAVRSSDHALCSMHARAFASQTVETAISDANCATVDDQWSEQYSRVGRVSGPYTVPPKPAFAVFEAGPTQFKVAQGDLIVTEKLRGVDVNDKVSFNRVLMLGSLHETIIGRPFVPDATVTAAVEEQFQDGKVLIFKKRRRKNSRRLNGHRQELTSLRILDINGIETESAPQPTKAQPQAQQHSEQPQQAAFAGA